MKIQVVIRNCLFVLFIPLFIQAEERPTPVSVVAVTIAPVYDEIPLTGSVTARRVSRISPKVDGFVSELLIDEGDEIKHGDALLQLDPVMAKFGLARAQAQVLEAEAILNEAKRQRDEAAELVQKKHISTTNHEARVAEVRIKAAALKRLQAELNQQRETLARHIVYAPFDGVVAKKEVEVGQWVETSSTLIELVEIKVLRVDVPVPQTYFSRITQGTSAEIKFDAFPEQSFKATVSMKIPVGNASTRTFPVRMEINNDERLIAPGMSARVRIMLEQAGQTKLLPRDTIVRKPDGSKSIWIIISENGLTKASQMSVKTGRSYRDNIEVFANDLQVGDKVVIRGNEILQENHSVNIVKEHEMKL